MELLAALEATSLATWIRESGSLWAYPLVLTLHTVGLGMLVGGNAVDDLRLLGVAEKVPLGSLHGLFKFMWIGFALNAISGALLFISDASTKGVQAIFWIKLAFIVVGVVATRLVQARVSAIRALESVTTTPRPPKWLALASLFLWVGAITAGRLMAYL